MQRSSSLAPNGGGAHAGTFGPKTLLAAALIGMFLAGRWSGASFKTLDLDATTAVPARLAFGVQQCAASSNIILLVLSRRDAFERRTVIRETWARTHRNVVFVVGQACV